MDAATREQARRAGEIAALVNAIKHGDDAQVEPIMGPLLGDHPELRQYGGEMAGVLRPVVEEVNDLSESAKRDRLATLDQEALDRLEAAATEPADERALPALPAVEDGQAVRMRLAPNPNGPWHLGNARMPAVIGRYKARYDGWMLCRFDDTDPETKRPDLDAYDAILRDLEYLGFTPDEVVRASDRMEHYYERARELIALGGAYTCSCPAESFRPMKAAGDPCPHREKPNETTRAEFDAMVAGEYAAGEMVLRVRTDMTHKNPALRDFVAFRIVDTPHPREQAAEYRAWPMLDFQSGIDDHAFDITHIIRGIDLQDSAKRQQFVYDYFDWEYPEVVHWGKVEIDAYDVPLSTSAISERISDGSLAGWADPRAPTIASVRRRGIQGEAIVEALAELGTSTSDVDLAMSSIYAANRELIDDRTDRAFLVEDGVSIPVDGGPAEATPPVHPDREPLGDRSIPIGDTVLLEAEDVPAAGDRLWLKGFGPVRYDGAEFQYTDETIEIVREGDVDVVHLLGSETVPVEIRSMDGERTGVAEPGITSYDAGDLLQFERKGFVRLAAVSETAVTCYYTHP